MKKIEVELFKYDELSKEVQKNVFDSMKETWTSDSEEFILKSLRNFGETFLKNGRVIGPILRNVE